MRARAVLLATAVLLAATPLPANAWGFEVHKLIVERAIPLLPDEIRPYFEQHRAEVVERSIDPDLWRTAGFEDEPPRHFVDLDHYGEYPFRALPREYDEAVARHGKKTVDEMGTAPWRTQEMYGKLVEAFGQKAPYGRENIKYLAAWVAHYISDAHQPFHATLNYDGQLTGQWGIHSRFETELVLRNVQRLRLDPAPPVQVKSARDFTFDALLASFLLVEPVLQADRAAVAGRDVYDDEYFELMFEKTRHILERRLNESIAAVASLIVSAWVEAGRPAVPLEAPRRPRPVKRPE